MSRLIMLVGIVSSMCGLSFCAHSSTDTAAAPAPTGAAVAAVDPKLTNDAILYYRELTAPLNNIREANFDYLQSVTLLRNAKAVEKKRQQLITTTGTNKQYFKIAPPFNNDSTLKVEFIRYLDMVEIVLKQDFDKILDMEEVEARSDDQEEAYQLALDMAVEKLRASWREFKVVDDAYFKRYGIKVNEAKDELTIKIEKANKALAYYDSIFRAFYKANKRYINAMMAVSTGDIASLEQHASTLASLADEGLGRLKECSAYEGNDAMIKAALAMLEFYKQEAKATLPANVEFSLKSDEMGKERKKFEAIKEDDRTREQIATYNQFVSTYNKTVSDINKINKNSAKSHQKLIKIWDKQKGEFFKQHT